MPALYTHTTRATGTILTSTIYNGDHQNHIDNGIPTMLDDYSSNQTEMQTQTDPGEVSSESLPTNLAGEIARLRFVIKRLLGNVYWYPRPNHTIPEAIVGMTGAIYGLELSNSVGDATNDITVSAGVALDITGTVVMPLAAAMTKQLDAAFVAGTNAGGRDTGAIADDWWFVWLIYNLTTRTADILFSASATAPTMPSGFGAKRLIGMFLRASSTIVAFTQKGDNFRFKVGRNDVNADSTNYTSTARLQALSVPDQIKVFPNIMLFTNTTLADMLVTSPDDTDSAVATTLMTTRRSAANMFVGEIGPSDTSGRLRFRTTSATPADCPTTITTLGWRFPRAFN